MGIVKSPYSAQSVLENELGDINERAAEASSILLQTASSIRWRKDSKTVYFVSLLAVLPNLCCYLNLGQKYFQQFTDPMV